MSNLLPCRTALDICLAILVKHFIRKMSISGVATSWKSLGKSWNLIFQLLWQPWISVFGWSVINFTARPILLHCFKGELKMEISRILVI